MTKRFLVVVDTQYDFMMPDGRLYVNGAEALIAPMIQHLAKVNVEEYEGVVLTFDTHEIEEYERSEEGKQFNFHCGAGTTGWSNVLNLDLLPADLPVFYLEKGIFDMWGESDLRMHTAGYKTIVERDEFFRKLSRDIIIEVIGVAADFCVKYAVDGFARKGFQVEVIRDLTKGIVRTIDETVADDLPISVKVI